MYRELYQYLILYQRLHLPGIGTLSVERISASFDFTSKLICPPAFTVALHNHIDNTAPSKKFFYWLGSQLSISERDAVIRFNDFLFDLRNQLSAGSQLQWSGVGTISKGPAGSIQLETGCKDHSPGSPVPAVMVLRQNAVHTVLVGEQEKVSKEEKIIEEDPAATGAGKSRWWLAALAAGIPALIFIVYYFSVNRFNSSAASNRQKLVPKTEVSAQ